MNAERPEDQGDLPNILRKIVQTYAGVIAPLAEESIGQAANLLEGQKSLDAMCDDNEELREYAIFLETRNWWQRLFNVRVQS